VLLRGPGGNGKSVLLNIVRALLGDDNVATVSLQVLAENRFAAAQLDGKLANICGDLDARAVRSSDLFKQLTGGDAVLAEHKYGQPFAFVSHALLLFSANEAPISQDQTPAWFDRWLIIPLDNRLTQDRVDPHLLAKLTTGDELSGLLARAVEGLRSLMERGHFDEPDSVLRARDAYTSELDTVRSFVAEECVVEKEQREPRSLLYQAYRLWCSEGGRLPLSAVSFNKRIRRDYPIELKVVRGDRRWEGIALRESAPFYRE
jgi:putative DNA primase/helicase